MESRLKEKLWAYIAVHNPELMLELQQEFSATRYLSEKVKGIMPMADQLLAEAKPQYVVEELCLNELTAELKPSKFLYVKEIVEQEFPEKYEKLRESGTLTYEVVGMIAYCSSLFESFGLDENGDFPNRLRHAVIAQVNDYLH